jgi:hypothetical protein
MESCTGFISAANAWRNVILFTQGDTILSPDVLLIGSSHGKQANPDSDTSHAGSLDGFFHSFSFAVPAGK